MTDFFDMYTPDSSVKSKNFANEGEEGQFETYGEDLEHVLKIWGESPERVWTMIDGDDGEILIVNGLRHVNRIAFLITIEKGNGETFFI